MLKLSQATRSLLWTQKARTLAATSDLEIVPSTLLFSLQ